MVQPTQSSNSLGQGQLTFLILFAFTRVDPCIDFDEKTSPPSLWLVQPSPRAVPMAGPATAQQRQQDFLPLPTSHGQAALQRQSLGPDRKRGSSAGSVTVDFTMYTRQR